jgi:hypothetical protein
MYPAAGAIRTEARSGNNQTKVSGALSCFHESKVFPGGIVGVREVMLASRGHLGGKLARLSFKSSFKQAGASGSVAWRAEIGRGNQRGALRTARREGLVFRRANFRSVFYDEGPRHGHGTPDQPVNYRVAWRAAVGGEFFRARSNFSFQPSSREPKRQAADFIRYFHFRKSAPRCSRKHSVQPGRPFLINRATQSSVGRFP